MLHEHNPETEQFRGHCVPRSELSATVVNVTFCIGQEARTGDIPAQT